MGSQITMRQVEPNPVNTAKIKFDQKVDAFFNKTFSSWGGKVARNPCKVFWLSILAFIFIASGMSRSEAFPDQQVSWTPKGNPSIVARDREAEMFPASGGIIGVLFEVKDGVDSLLSVTAFVEMQAFAQGVNELKAYVGENKNKTLMYSDICTKIKDKCLTGKDPLTFFQDENGDDKFGDVNSEQELMNKLRSGKGGSF
jgi:hypothetical protein